LQPSPSSSTDLLSFAVGSGETAPCPDRPEEKTRGFSSKYQVHDEDLNLLLQL
jgi:hypothetical protein